MHVDSCPQCSDAMRSRIDMSQSIHINYIADTLIPFQADPNELRRLKIALQVYDSWTDRGTRIAQLADRSAHAQPHDMHSWTFGSE